MRIHGKLKEGFFLARLNRFAALVAVDGREEVAHLPNSGRLREVLLPHVPVLLAPRANPARKTAHDLAMVRLEGRFISVDARVPNALVYETLRAGRLPGFEGYHSIRQEVRYAGHRLDMLAQNGTPCLIEAKSITLVEEGKALFPDAPTLRGAEHMRALLRFRQEGFAAAAIFVIQREDACCFAPNDSADPHFGRALREASAGGVMVRAFLCRVRPEEIVLDGEVPAHL